MADKYNKIYQSRYHLSSVLSLKDKFGIVPKTDYFDF